MPLHTAVLVLVLPAILPAWLHYCRILAFFYQHSSTKGQWSIRGVCVCKISAHFLNILRAIVVSKWYCFRGLASWNRQSLLHNIMLPVVLQIIVFCITIFKFGNEHELYWVDYPQVLAEWHVVLKMQERNGWAAKWSYQSNAVCLWGGRY